MVYCPECGTENDDEAVYCTRCGAVLKGEPGRVYYSRRRGEKYEKDEKDEKEEKHEKHEMEEKYEKSGEEGRTWGIIIGLLILLAGAISLLNQWYVVSWQIRRRLWSLMIIVFGLLIIWGGLRARRRSPRP